MKAYSPRAAIKWTLIALLSFNLAAEASVLYFDDFETPLPGPLVTDAVTFWVDTTKDADPIGPVGKNWVVNELAPPDFYVLQVGRFPQDIDPAGGWAPGNAGPTWDTSPTGEEQYLHMYGNNSTQISQSWAPLSLADQATIAANGTLHLSLELYGLSGPDGWRTKLRIAGYDSAAMVGTSPAFNLIFTDGALAGQDGLVTYVGAGGVTNSTGLANQVTQWQKVDIDVHFATDTFDLTIDGNTTNGLTWAGGDLSKIQTVVLEVSPLPGLNSRGGFDNFELSSAIPEPSTVMLLGVGSLLMVRRARGAIHARTN